MRVSFSSAGEQFQANRQLSVALKPAVQRRKIYKNENNLQIKNVTIYVNEKEISKATGQKGKNKETLLTEGFSVAIKGKSDLDIYEIQIEEN